MDYDAIIIGAGQAGVPLAGRLAAAGQRTALIERGPYGGTCVNTGCTPTKTWVASARRAWALRTASELGIGAGSAVQVDMERVKARKDQIVQDSRRGLKDKLENTENLSVYRGQAAFVGPRSLRVQGETLEAERIFINVGGRPRTSADFPPGTFMTNADILELSEVPEHLLVVGGGYIGLEFAQMFRRFGSEVTVIERGHRLLSREDPDVCDTIRDLFDRAGIEVRLDAECLRSQRRGDRIAVDLDCVDGPPEAEGSHLLLAAGRQPNTDDLGLEHTQVELDERGYIQVNDRLETTAPGIWALGDCNGRGAFTHTAYNDYEIVAANLLDGGSRRVSDRIACYALYIDPPLGRVGMTETQAESAGKKFRVAKREMSRIARAKEKGETDGFMKFLVEEGSDQILGATVFGTGGDEVVHSVLDLMYAGASYELLSRQAVHIHPTVSELIPTTLQGLD